MSKKKSTATKSPNRKSSTKALAAATSPRAARVAKDATSVPSGKAARGARLPRTSALNAAATILADASKAMTVKELIAVMEERKLWKSPGGKTPDATLASAIGREIKVSGSAARFRKAGRGLFEAGIQKPD